MGESSFERLVPGGNLLADRDLTYYDLSLGYNLFPGEVFIGSKRAFNSSVYLIGGVGSVDFAGDNNFSLNFGFGIKVLPTDYLSLRLEARDSLFDSELTDADQKKTTHNLQYTLNLGIYF